jgi:Ion transport protein
MFVDSSEGDLLFPSLMEGLWTVWICVTTANYPDVMMPGYNENRFVALYFVSFMILSFFFLMNVILATVCNEYDTAVAQHRTDHAKKSKGNLQRPYQLLTLEEQETMHGVVETQGIEKIERIDRKTAMDLFSILNNDFPEFRRLSPDETHILFAILDRDGTSRISEEEFMSFGNVLMLEFHRSSDYASSIEVHFPRFFHSREWQRFRSIVIAPSFEYVIDFILILNAIVVGIQSWPLLSDQKVVLDAKLVDGSIDTSLGMCTYQKLFMF